MKPLIPFLFIIIHCLIHLIQSRPSELVNNTTYNCLCSENKEYFQEKCNYVKKYKITRTFVACYCICPQKELKIIYPFQPAPRWDKYHKDQEELFKLVSLNQNFQQGGVILAFWGDEAYFPISVTNDLHEQGIPTLSHSYPWDSAILNGQLDPKYLQDRVILIPDHLFIRNEGYLKLIQTFEKHNHALKERKPIVFWRGSASGPIYGEPINPRYELCKASLNLSYVDAKISKVFNDKTQRLYIEENILGAFSNEMAWVEHRGIIDIDGSVNAWGLFWKLASGSVVYKVDSPYINPYIMQMKPWVHYIPIHSNFSNLEEVTKFVTVEETLPFIQQIANNAKELTKQFTLPKEIDRVSREITNYFQSKSPQQQPQQQTQPSIATNSPPTTPSTSAASLSFMQHRVKKLLHELNHYVDVHTRYPDLIRFNESHFAQHFPPNYHFSEEVDTCLVKKELACPLFDSFPQLPTLSNPLATSETLSWTEEIEKYHGPTNKRTIADLKPSFKTSCQLPIEEPSSKRSEDCPTSRHIILTMIEGYNCNRISLFLRSIRDSGICAEIVVFTKTIQNRACQIIEESCGKISFVMIDKFKDLYEEHARFITGLHYLNERLTEDPTLWHCTQVAYVDSGDVFFQRDPFHHTLTNYNAELIMTEESYDSKNVMTSIEAEPTTSNRLWVEEVSTQLFGHSIVPYVGKMPAINCGLIIGTFQGMYKTLWLYAYLTDMLDTYHNHKETGGVGGVSGQGLTNVMYYSGLWQRIVKVRVLSPEYSYFINGCYHHPVLLYPNKPFDFQTNPVVNGLGQPYAMVHQFNRFHMMQIVEDWILNYGKLNWKFQVIGPAPLCNITTTN